MKLFDTMVLIFLGLPISLAAAHMEQGFLRGAVFGTCLGLAYILGRES